MTLLAGHGELETVLARQTQAPAAVAQQTQAAESHIVVEQQHVLAQAGLAHQLEGVLMHAVGVP